MTKTLDLKHFLSEENRLIKNLNLLKEEERANFKKWLSSGWCNSRKDLVKFFEILLKYFISTQKSTISKREIYRKLYTKKPFSDQGFDNLMSHLSIQVERYMVFSRIQRNERLYKQFLIQEFDERNAGQRFKTESEDLIKEIQAQESLSWDDLGDLLNLLQRLYYSQNTRYGLSAGLTPLDKAHDILESYNKLGTLKLSIEQKEREKKYRKEKTELIESAETLSSHIPTGIDATIQLYQKWDSLINSKQENGLEEFQKLYLKQVDQLHEEDRRNIFLYMMNEGGRRYLSGDLEIVPVLLELYQFGFDSKILLQHDSISSLTFANSQTLAYVQGREDLANLWKSKYASSLPNNTKAEVLCWVEAYELYSKGSYEEAIEKLKKQKFTIGSFKQRSTMLIMQSYFGKFMKGEFLLKNMLNVCHAFGEQMREETSLTDGRKKALVKLTQYVQRLGKWKSNPNRTEKHLLKIRTDLEREDSIQAKPWLLSIIKQFEGGLQI